MEHGIIGRNAEITEISAFLSAASGAPAALIITGDAGIGKTVLWRHVRDNARRSSRVLSCQPAPAEKPLAFSALDDLFDDAADEVVPALSVPRRQAVEIALLRGSRPRPMSAELPEADRLPPEPRVLARAILDAVRILAGIAPLTIAVDDAQWLDRPSAGALEFCFRRLQGEPVLLLLTARTGEAVPLGLDRALPPDRLCHVQLGPLTLGAIGDILRSRLGTVLPRHSLTRLYDACGGNPFFALEYARMFLDDPRVPLTNEPIPLPPGLSGLVRHRLRRLTPDVRRVAWLVAASSNPRERVIRAAYDDSESWAAIDQAIDEGILDRDGDVLRFTHPLLQSGLYDEMSSKERKWVHQRLGVVVEDVEERAWHLALGADKPTEEIAGILGSAANHAAARGAPEEGAALAEQAARLTPTDRPEAVRERVMYAADCHFRAARIDRSRELIQSVLPSCPGGPPRASLLIRLATIHYHQRDWPLAEETFRQAVQEASEDPRLCAHAQQELAFARGVAGDLHGALHWAKASLRSAERAADTSLAAHSLARIAVFEFLLGNGVQSALLERAEMLSVSADEEPTGRLPLFSPSFSTGLVLKWCDRLGEARLRLAREYEQALDRGEEASLPFLLYHFSELECWSGNWDAAEEYALEGCRVADEGCQQTMRPATLYSLALVRALRGEVVQARKLASEALALCERTGNVPVTSLLLSVLGFVAVSLDEYQAAHAHLGQLAAATAATGLGEPSVVKFFPDEIEALAALGEVDLARSLTRQLEGQGKSLQRPWALATGARCRAHLAAIDGDLEGALAACGQALVHHGQLTMPFELGRTLLVKGMIERRARRKSAADESFSRALAIFERLGASLWAGKVRREMSKIGMRRPVSGLSETEHRIAALISQGKTNREVASAMFVTENTVQTHVRHIFQKLGVRSRTELAAQFLSTAANPVTAGGAAVGSEPLRSSGLSSG